MFYICYRKIRGKHEVDFRDTLTGDGPYSLLSLAILFSWINLACLLLRHGYNPNKYHLYDLAIDVKASMGELGEDFRTLVRCVFDAGYKFKPREEEQLECLLCAPHSGYDEVVITWMKSFNRLQTLQALCMYCIRQTLRIHTKQKSIIRNIEQLDLPSALKDHLSLEKYRENPTEAIKVQQPEDPLYFAMPKQRIAKTRHVYLDFWHESCCWSK